MTSRDARAGWPASLLTSPPWPIPYSYPDMLALLHLTDTIANRRQVYTLVRALVGRLRPDLALELRVLEREAGVFGPVAPSEPRP